MFKLKDIIIKSKLALSFKEFLIICLLAFGCNNSELSDLKEIQVIKGTETDLYLSEIASSINIIQLETNPESLISSIYDLKIFQDKIFVKDRNKQILVFDKEGNFIRNLVQQGDGPMETKTVNSFEIDGKSGKIYISGLNKLLTYSKDQNFLEEKSFSINLNHLTMLENKLFAIAEYNMNPIEKGFTNETILFEMSPELEFKDSISLRKIVLDQKIILGFHNRNYISRVGDKKYVYIPTPPTDKIFRDTLYEIKDKILKPNLKLNFGVDQFTDNGNKAILIRNVYVSKDYLLCEYDHDNKKKFFLYHFKNAKGYNLNEGFLDDQGDKVVLRPLDLNNNVFYYTKTKEFSVVTSEELNPEIGIVKLN
ncbi:hypothetical protein B879_03286 [Cecembia lonarensis LW9]|uniref:6-bladed beta-propeller n=2 Tax=Cecembia TaxID=1187078 RepID=K1L008_CECL9|nr:hypothetical protein B879_03286 [Cecembia lonarensis LW9]